MQAVILAGGALNGNLKEAFPTLSNKAHLNINGKILVEYVLAAVLDCHWVEKVFIVGDKDFLITHICNERVTILQDTGNIYDNFILAADCGQVDKMLLLTADVPLIDSKALDDFTKHCVAGRDIYYSIVSQAAILRYDDQTRRTYAKVGKQIFTGGNVFLVDVSTVRRIRPAIEAIFAKRKSVFALLKMVGVGFVLKYIFGVVELEDIERCFGKILNANVQAVVCEHASIGIDVDKLEDLDLVKRHLK